MILLLANLLVILANALIINGECQCGIFLMDDSGNSAMNELYLSSTHPQVCERLEFDQLCRDFCYEKFVNLTANGNLESTSPVFNMSSGEMFCKNLQREVDRREVGGYYRWCQASWKFVGIKSSHSLCCTNTSYIRCEDEDVQLAVSTEPAVELVATKTDQSETNEALTTSNIVSNKSDDSEDESSPISRKKRNLVEIIEAPRKLSQKSFGSGRKMLMSKLTSPRPKRSVTETTAELDLAALNSSVKVEEDDTNVTSVTEAATEKSVTKEEKQTWSPEVNSSDWIPIRFLPYDTVPEAKEIRRKRETTRGQVSPFVHLTTDVLVETNGSAEDVAKDGKTSQPRSEEDKTDEEISLKWLATIRIVPQEETTMSPNCSLETIN